MTVYVDDATWRWRGKLWCHVFSEDLDELHAFALGIGLKREWFQEPPAAKWPHYDTVASRRLAAIRAGAVPVSKREMVAIARRIKEAHCG